MCTLGQSIINDLNRINFTCCPWQLCNEIHGNFFTFRNGNGQWLHFVMGYLTFSLDFPTSQAVLYKPCYFPLHTGPPITQF